MPHAAATPREVYAHHAAGRDGRGGGSAIDSLICRDRELDGSAAREERLYDVQNWRYDVVALIHAPSSSDMKVVERIRYDAYGRPTSFSPADVGRAGGGGGVPGPDGLVDNDDAALFGSSFSSTWFNDYGTGSGGNFLPDGTFTAQDATGFGDAEANVSGHYGGGGFGVLSHGDLDNRVGWVVRQAERCSARVGFRLRRLRQHARGYRFDPTLNRAGHPRSLLQIPQHPFSRPSDKPAASAPPRG